jgi:hypothetical protein
MIVITTGSATVGDDRRYRISLPDNGSPSPEHTLTVDTTSLRAASTHLSPIRLIVEIKPSLTADFVLRPGCRVRRDLFNRRAGRYLISIVVFRLATKWTHIMAGEFINNEGRTCATRRSKSARWHAVNTRGPFKCVEEREHGI